MRKPRKNDARPRVCYDVPEPKRLGRLAERGDKVSLVVWDDGSEQYVPNYHIRLLEAGHSLPRA